MCMHGATTQSVRLLVQYGDESKLTRLFVRHVNVHVWRYEATESREAMLPLFE